MSNTLKFTASIDDNVSSKLTKIRGEFDRLGGRGSAASLFGNVGAKAIATGFSLIGAAAESAGGFLTDVVHAGMAEEASLARLTQSLKDNVPGWNGNIEAINNLIAAHDDLGFKEGDQRASLSLLLGATHDVSKAFEVQKVAMDLARFKGVDLQTATEALTKVEAGSYRILKSLGIQLPKNATQQDALNAVTKVANDQAKAYAETLSGKLDKAQVKIDASMEHLGKFTMPVVASALDNLSNAFELLSGNKSYKLTGALLIIRDAFASVLTPLARLIDLANVAVTAAQTLGSQNFNPGPGTGHGGRSAPPPRHAAGGWVGLNGPELAVVGERGPEYVVPNHQLNGNSGGFTIKGVSERQIIEMVDRGLFFKLQRATPTLGRT